MPEYLDLKRDFVLRTKYSVDELMAAEVTGKRLTWPQVLEGKFAVIVARANFGKSTELFEQARRLRAGGIAAVCVALHKVLLSDKFEDALDGPNLTALEEWRLAPSKPLTVFVDSLDEASLSRAAGIQLGMRRVVGSLNWPNSLLRWVFSTRPAMLNDEVLSQITTLMGTTLETEVKDDNSPLPPAGPRATGSRLTETSVLEPLRVFSLMGLQDEQAARYLAERRGIASPQRLLDAAKNHGFSGLCDSPGGLDILVAVDPVTKPPTCLTDAFQRVVAAMQKWQRTDTREQAVGGPPPPGLANAAQKLAAASVLCQLQNIEMPQDRLFETGGVLSARLLLGAMLPESVQTYLLGTQLFIDVGHHQVKLYPDELLPFLAAQRLSLLANSPEQAFRLVELITWKASTGEKGVYRTHLAVAGWLATFNRHCRRELVDIDPQAVAFFGDLRSPEFDGSEAEAVLRASLTCIAKDGDRLGRGHFTLTSENFWQAGRPGLEPLLCELFDEFKHVSHARQVLLDIATHSQSDVLKSKVLNCHGGDYLKLIQHGQDVHYLIKVGGHSELTALNNALLTSDSLGESLVGFLLSTLAWKYLSAKLISEFVGRQFERGRGGFHLAWTLNHDIARAANIEQLYAISRGVIRQLLASRRGKLGKEHRYDVSARFVALALELLAKLVERGNADFALRIANLCIVAKQFVDTEQHGSVDNRALRNALAEVPVVRHAVLAHMTRQSVRAKSDLYSAIYGYGSFCPVLDGDVEAVGESAFTAVVTEFQTDRAAAAALLRPKPKKQKSDVSLEPQFLQRLPALASKLSDGTAETELTVVALWLSRTNAKNRYGEVELSVFELEVEPSTAGAVRAGFRALWRTKQPTYKEEEPNSTYGITVAGLQGLHLDLADGTLLPSLAEAEVRQALRYAPFEINGYPVWFWSLVRAHEGVALDELRVLLQSAGAGVVSRGHAESLLTSLDEAPKGIQEGLALLAWEFVLKEPHAREYVLEHALRAATAATGVVSPRLFEAEARRRMSKQFGGVAPTDEPLLTKWRESRAQGVIWGICWLWHFPDTFQKQMESWDKRSKGAVNDFMFTLAAQLEDDRHHRLAQLAQSGPNGVQTLKYLYNRVQCAVRREEDADHTDGEVYSVDTRDRAERLRDSIIPAIAQAQSQDAYAVLGELRLADDGRQDKYLRHVQFRMQEDLLVRPPLAQQDFDRFEADLSPSLTDSVSFAMAINADLLLVKEQIEKGEFSLRRFFSSLKFDRATAAGEGLALEADFQAYLGSELNHLCANRYGVTLESQLPEATRRDLLCRKDSYYASIELKMSERWAVADFLESLEKQLVGQYMRARNSKAGFFVVVLQRVKTWDVPGSDMKVGFEGLISLLSSRAQELMEADRSRFLRVIGINATAPTDFRAERVTSSKSAHASSNKMVPPGKSVSTKKPTKGPTAQSRKSRKPGTAP